MSDKKYNFQKKVNEKKIAKACKQNAPISTKYSVEFSNYFKNKPLDKAIKICEDIINKEDHLPLKKYNKKVAHRKGDSKRGVASGRWPIKAATTVKALLEDVKANAENLNLDTEKLKIIHMFAVKGVTRRKTQPLGRTGGKQRESKSTNIEVIVLEE
ncbi:MAG: 50S ribosomal protein L22 [Candidatus ainarchaeum sp.]|jgi:large subunit ribosomal protein L22|nr:50S ribosomal protein L22 [Candidatus ainarchaeum sp.]